MYIPTGLAGTTEVIVWNTLRANAIFYSPPNARMKGVSVENKLLE